MSNRLNNPGRVIVYLRLEDDDLTGEWIDAYAAAGASELEAYLACWAAFDAWTVDRASLTQ